MESKYPEKVFCGRKNVCARTDTVFFPISEVSKGTVSLKLSKVYYYIQVNLKTIKVKDYRTLEAKLSLNKPQLPHLKNRSMNITNWHTSRIRFPIRSNNEKKKIVGELSDIFKCEQYMKTFTASAYMAHTLFIQRTLNGEGHLE